MFNHCTCQSIILTLTQRLHFDQEAIDSNEEFQGLAAQQNKIREELEKVKGKIGEFKERLKSDDLDDKVAG